MKQITNMSRLVNQLEKTFKMLNRDFFDDVLPMPIITVIPVAKSYAHYVPYPIWETRDGGKHEINIASGTLDRDIELIVASLLHEMVHMYNNCIANVQDTSRGNTYHNKYFAREAERRGLIVTRSDKHGFAHTKPSDMILEWVIDHDELRDVEICRTNSSCPVIGIGTHSNNGGEFKISGTVSSNNSRKYMCPCCRNSVRATKKVNIVCGDCNEQMTEV